MKKLKMRSNQTPGLLITFCGLDGSGKTTMMRMLESDLKGKYDLYITKQPTPFVRQSDIFRTYMDSPNHDTYDYRSLSLLAASDRIQHVNKELEPIMNTGSIVLSDRYFYSCLANLRARGFIQDKWIYEISESIIKPDIAFFFDINVTDAISRVRNRESEKDRYIDIDLQFRLRNEYINICTKNNGILVSTALSVEESYHIVKEKVEEVISTNEHFGKNNQNPEKTKR